MSIRQAVVFLSRIALAYTRIALVSTLRVTALASLLFLVISGGMLLIDSTTTVDKVIYAARLITIVVSATASILSILAGIGLAWNVTGLALGFVRQSDELDLEQLPAEIPRYLPLFNMVGLPVFIFTLGLLFQAHPLVVIIWSIGAFLSSLFSVDIAARAWKRVISTYPLYTQNGKKKKNIPLTEESSIEDAETEDFMLYEDVQHELMKR